jgi:RNA polymerase sigma-70 factor (ECF subfamily)
MKADPPARHARPVEPTALLPSCRPGGCAYLCSEAGLAAAHDAYRSRLLARARRVVGDPDLAEEAVQEAFLRGWRACSTFDPAGAPVLSWLLVITANAAVDLARARARRPPLVAPTQEASDRLPDALGDVDLLLLRAELGDALAAIGPDQRTAVVETFLRDRPYAEVAAELGIPVGTLRTRIYYGLRRLREAMVAQEQRPAPAAPPVRLPAQAAMTTGMIIGRRRSLPPTHLPTTRRTTCCSS